MLFLQKRGFYFFFISTLILNMPLIIDDKVVEEPEKTLEDFEEFLRRYRGVFQYKANWLHAHVPVQIHPDDPFLYLLPTEVGCVRPNDAAIKYIGTDLLTTNLAVIIRCPQSNVTALGNFVGTQVLHGIKEMVEALFEASLKADDFKSFAVDKHFEVSIIGGAKDEMDICRELSMEILRELHELSPVVHRNYYFELRTFCCADLNGTTAVIGDKNVPVPVIYGIGVHVKTGDLFPVSVLEKAKSPALLLRSAQRFFGQPAMKNVYNWNEGEFIVRAFNYAKRPDAEEILKMTDAFLLEIVSPTPEAEPFSYVDHIRSVLHFVICNPCPVKSIFWYQPAIAFTKLTADCWHDLAWPDTGTCVRWSPLFHRKGLEDF